MRLDRKTAAVTGCYYYCINANGAEKTKLVGGTRVIIKVDYSAIIKLVTMAGAGAVAAIAWSELPDGVVEHL